MRNLISTLLISALVTAAAGAQEDPTARETVIEFGGPERVVIETQSGTAEFTVEIAETPEQMQRGLMWRETLDPATGMLFRYEPVRPASMWMENTLVSLDILYIEEDGTIAKIIAYAQPNSRRSLGSDANIAGVLELAGGRAVELEIRPGDTVLHRFFDPVIEGVADEAADATADETVSDAQ